MKRVSGVDFEVRLKPRRPGDPATLVARVDRIRNLGWAPRHDIWTRSSSRRCAGASSGTGETLNAVPQTLVSHGCRWRTARAALREPFVNHDYVALGRQELRLPESSDNHGPTDHRDRPHCMPALSLIILMLLVGAGAGPAAGAKPRRRAISSQFVEDLWPQARAANVSAPPSTRPSAAWCRTRRSSR